MIAKTGRNGLRTYSPNYWINPRVEARPSAIQGSGGFAKAAIHAGEVVVIIGGVPMTESEFRAFQAKAERYDAVQIGEDLHLVDTTDAIEEAGVSLNHSCDSNLWMRDEVTLVARREIASGEEITVDYALFTTQPDWKLEIACNCGSPFCRHEITGNDWQLPDPQARYKGHFSPFINARIEDQL
jgi:SET domain-containing protein